jgi:thiol:disulfide interchange protein DsbA
MKLRNAFVSGLFAIILSALIVAVGSAGEWKSSFPAYGSGSVEVRIYSDYFCSSCQAMESAVDPILKDLLKKKAIRLTLVDTPLHPYTTLYAKYFLYALGKNNSVDHAFRVRSVLIGASADKSITTKERLEAIFKKEGIPYAVFDTKPAFDRYNALLKEDKIKSTPTCVVIMNGQKKTFVGGPDIIDALNFLKALQ